MRVIVKQGGPFYGMHGTVTEVFFRAVRNTYCFEKFATVNLDGRSQAVEFPYASLKEVEDGK